MASTAVGPVSKTDLRRRHTVADVTSTLNKVMNLRKPFNTDDTEKNSKDNNTSTETLVQMCENEGKSYSTADVAKTFMNVMKFCKQSDVTNNGDDEKSKDIECVTEKRLSKGPLGFKLPPRRSSLSADESKSNSSSMSRRKSSFRGFAQGLAGMLRLRRLTMSKTESLKPKIRYENTYKMSPDSGKHFAISKIEQIAENILKEEIADRKYNSCFAGNMTRTLSTKIQNKVKEMDLPRYKIVCQVVLTEISSQGIESASRCLWDHTSDNFTTATYNNETISATAMIFGIYFE